MINSFYSTEVTGSYPVTIAEAKDVLEIIDDRHNAKIQMMIAAATSKAENRTGQILSKKKYILNMDNAFIGQKIKSPIHPLLSIDSITYLQDGNTLTLAIAEYEYDIHAFPPFVKILTMPSYDMVTNAIKINVTAGYQSMSLIPADIKQAILFHVYQSFLNRGADEDIVDETFNNMLTPYRYIKL